MKKWFCFLITISFSVGFSQSEYHYLVKFNSKKSKYSLSFPEEYLSSKSVNRREIYQVEIDSMDLPINSDYLNSIKQYSLKIEAKSKWYNCIVISTDIESIDDSIKSHSFVQSIELIGEITLKKKNSKKFNYGLNQNQIESLNVNFGHNLGFRGKDVDIAVIDGGFSGLNNNSFFDSLFLNNQIKTTYNFVTNNTVSYNNHGHGSNVISLLGANIDDLFVGIAPSSNYHLLITEDINQENKIEEFHLIEALEYCDSIGIDLINISLGYSTFDDVRFSHSKSELSGDSILLNKACNLAWRNGAFIVASAGNMGGTEWGVVTAPANADSLFAVGAVNNKKEYAYFSSKGNPSINSTLKPNVVAIGEQVRIVNQDGIIEFTNGTSFSAPQITGLVSCLMEAFPKKKNWELRNAIEFSGLNSSAPDSIVGHGVPHFEKAYIYLKNKYFFEKINDLTVYPNPSSGILTVTNKHAISEIQLFDIRGKKVINLKPNMDFVKLNITHLSAGIYFIKSKDKKGEKILKIEVL